MVYLPIIILALIQGITEFLPISSSGHLVLAHYFLEEDVYTSPQHHKIMDIAVHVGTLIAVMLYFRADVAHLIKGGIHTVRHQNTSDRRLFLSVLVGSLPVIILGAVLFQIDLTIFDSLAIVAWMTLIFGVVLYFGDRFPESVEMDESPSIKQSLIYGLFQCVALVPGVSRSGITITAGRLMKHSRVEAARFSLLLGMVAIAGAGCLAAVSLLSDIAISADFWMILALGALISCVAAYLAIYCMMRWISKASFTPFVIYRIILGISLLVLLYSGVIPQNM